MDDNNKRKVDANVNENTDLDNKKMKLTDLKTKSKIQIIKLSTAKPKESDLVEEIKRKESQSGVNSIEKRSTDVLSVFGDDNDDDDVQQLPFEAKMRMRNIGRNTPTASGPNSYGKKGQLGFCDHRKLFEKKLEEKADELSKHN